MKRPRQGGNMTLARHALDIAMAAGSASTQTWPNTSIRPVEPSAPGKLADLIVRHGAEPLSRTIATDNKAGNGRMLRTSHARRSTLARKGPARAGATPAGYRSAE